MLSKFKNAIDSVKGHHRFCSCPGCAEKLVYSSVYDDDREKSYHLEITGKENLYLEIQSWKDSCDLNLLIKRYTSGDVGALSQRQGFYGDVTGMPKTYAEMLTTIDNARTFFDSLDLETSAKFDHSFDKFVASMDNMDEFLKNFGVAKDAVPAPAGGETND